MKITVAAVIGSSICMYMSTFMCILYFKATFVNKKVKFKKLVDETLAEVVALDNDVTQHLMVSSPLCNIMNTVILGKAFSVPSSLPYLSFTYEPPTQVLTCLAFIRFIIFIHTCTKKCYAKHFGINPTLSYYFLLLFLPILV